MTNNSGTGEVVALHGRVSCLRDADIMALVRYWMRMRRAGDVPRRSEIDPREIEALLENAMIVEKIAPGLARMRIAGSHLTDLMGMEVRGMPVSAFFAPDDRDAVADHLTDLFDRPAIVDLGLRSVCEKGCAVLTGRLVLLPLRSDLGDVSRALGCLVTQGQIGRGPRRFALTSRKTTSISVPTSSPVSVRELAESPAPYLARPPRSVSERSYLRVVK